MVAPGVHVLSTPVAGLSSEPALARLERSFARPLTIAFRGVTIAVSPADLGAGADVRQAVRSALSAAPGTRVALRVQVPHATVETYVRGLALRFDTPSISARLLGGTAAGPIFRQSKTGLAVQTRPLVAAIEHELASDSRTPLALPVEIVQPARTAADFGSVIVIDRQLNTLALFSGTRLVHRFGVATGQSVYPTPAGMFRIVDKQENPWWTPPSSSWAKGLKPVPPGPGNPLGTRWMGLDSPGVGIHGTPDDASIGYSESHGCVRMHIPDAEWLFGHVDVGTPVVIL